MTPISNIRGRAARLGRLDFGDTNDEPDINLMPLIDVVLIVLIFFITTTSFIPPLGVDIERVTAEQVTRQSENSARIVLTADNTVIFNGARYTPAALADVLAALRADRPQLSVVIAADQRARAATLLNMIDRLRKIGVEHIALGAETAQP